MGRYRIVVDRERCVGSGHCAGAAAGVFELDEAAKAVVRDPDAADDAAIRKAAEGCPTAAILLVEGETGRQVHP